MTFAPFVRRSSIVGRLSRIRVSSVIRIFSPISSVGTLKSTRTRTRRPFTSRSRTDSFAILFVWLQDVLQQIDTSIRIAPFVIVPADQFEESTVQPHAGRAIEDARVRAVEKICRDNLILRICQNPLEIGLAGLFHRGADVLVAGFLDCPQRQVNYGDSRSRNPE